MNPEDEIKGKKKTINERWQELKNVTISTISKILNNFEGEYEKVKVILNPMLRCFIRLYSEEESHIDMSFFFGIGLDTILECIFSIVSLMKIGL